MQIHTDTTSTLTHRQKKKLGLPFWSRHKISVLSNCWHSTRPPNMPPMPTTNHYREYVVLIRYPEMMHLLPITDIQDHTQKKAIHLICKPTKLSLVIGRLWSESLAKINCSLCASTTTDYYSSPKLTPPPHATHLLSASFLLLPSHCHFITTTKSPQHFFVITFTLTNLQLFRPQCPTKKFYELTGTPNR